MKKLLFLIALIISFPGISNAQTELNVTRGTLKPLPIAIPYLVNNSGSGIEVDIIGVIESDLERSGLFEPVHRNAFIQDVKGVDQIPDFASWRKIDADYLVTGEVTEGRGGEVKIDFRLWDTRSEKQITGKSFTAPEESWRRVAHLVADEIYSRLTGEKGYFDSRIVYVAESGGWKKKTKRLAIMDQDGANHKYLTSGNNLVLTPRFDPSQQRIIYMGYYGKVPSVYLYDLESGDETMLGNFPGMSFAPRFSPDGRKVIMSISERGNTNIYVMDLVTRKRTRITDSNAIDTSPSFSPDGKRITFNSDRGGSQQLYVMNADGSNVKRISFGKGTYGTPVWSPRGDLIAFTKMAGPKFYIGVMKTDGSGERLLTESFMDEGPTWSPNGRVIMFMRQTPSTSTKPGVARLYSVDLTGYNERLVTTPSEASDPAWSPLLSTQRR